MISNFSSIKNFNSSVGFGFVLKNYKFGSTSKNQVQPITNLYL
jgi:hypothetical protein